MPDFTMASAMPRTSSSLTLQPNLFQEFHPMGGVRARPLETALSSASAAALSDEMKRISKNNFLDMCVGLWTVAMKCTHFYQNIASGGRAAFDNRGWRF